MNYIEHQLLDPKFDNPFTFNHLTTDDPIISPITVEWQIEKCALLELPFEQRFDQDSTIAGQKLRLYEPRLCDTIRGDGNCLFGCLSKIISGSEEYHAKIRGEICRYMLSDGVDIIDWYLRDVLKTTPANYLNTKIMYKSGEWASDVELMTASALLNTDIYIANRIYKSTDSLIPEVRWSRIRPSNNNNQNYAIYIANYHEHYEPVTRMIDSLTPTFSSESTGCIAVD